MDYSNGKWRMYRIGNPWDMSIYGEWCDTKKAAKASYKEALRKSKERAA